MQQPITRNYRPEPTLLSAGVVASRLRQAFVIPRLILVPASDAITVSPWRLLALNVPFPALAVAAGFLDSTLRLQADGGRGVLEHVGYHALFASVPVLSWLVSRLLSQLSLVLASSHYMGSIQTGADPLALQKELLEVAECRPPRLQSLLLLFRFVGISAVVANAASTRHPVAVYGQDVFDAGYHLWGYVAGRLFLSYYWVGLLPVVAYVALAATYCTFRVVRRFTEQERYMVAAFAADGCGGFRPLGTMMMSIVYLYFPIAGVIAALAYTHRNLYSTLVTSTVLVCALVASHLFLPFIRLHRLLVRLKQQKLLELEQFLASAETALQAVPKVASRERDLTRYLQLLAGGSLYQQTIAMPTWPYLPADRLKWLTPLVPMVVSVILKRLAASF